MTVSAYADSCMELASTDTVRVYIIEAQELLVPPLVEVFKSIHARVENVTQEIDDEYIAAAHPDVIFLDGDYVSEGLAEGIYRVWHAWPRGKLIVFCSPATANKLSDRYIWMTSGVIPKSAGKQRLRRLLERAIWMRQG